MIRLAFRVLLIVLLAAGSAQPQTPGRRLATIDALKQFPGFYHLQNILIRGEFADAAPRLRLRADEHDVRVMLDDGVATKSGSVEVRGLLIDVGRLEPGDPRVGSYTEGRDADRWPRPGEELIVRASGVSQVPPAASTPSVRAIALEPWKFDGQKVTVVGNFRGRNLFGDLPGAPGKSKYDFVLRGAEGAVWVTNMRPKVNNFDLDVNRRVDSDRWLEVTGTIVRDHGLVSIEATKLAFSKAPQVTEAPAESAVPAAPLEPVQIVFSSPTDGETDVTPSGSIRIQFSRGLNQRSFEGQIRVSYLGAPRPEAGAPPASLAFTTSYDAGSRSIQIKMSQPLDAFATVRVELLEGIKAFDGGPLAPWTLTFSVGG